jgi:hypothetical protein
MNNELARTKEHFYALAENTGTDGNTETRTRGARINGPSAALGRVC